MWSMLNDDTSLTYEKWVKEFILASVVLDAHHAKNFHTQPFCDISVFEVTVLFYAEHAVAEFAALFF